MLTALERFQVAKTKTAPLIEAPDIRGSKWSEPWRQLLRDLSARINERPEVKGTVAPGNPVTVDTDGDIVDSGIVVPSSEIANEEYVQDYTGERYQTENQLPEAGTEEGARHGSYKIGLLTENDYAYFDENGKLIFYGITGVQIVIPLNTTAPEKFAVFDVDGNLKHRTAEQLSDDLSGYLATKQYASETFITENLVEEAGTEEGHRLGSYAIGDNDGNETLFEEDGTLVFNGDATVWDDLRVNAGSIDRPGVDDPTFVVYYPNGGGLGVALLEFALNDFASFTVQLPHNYKEGEDIYVHVHWTPGDRGNEESGNTVGWKIDYSWANRYENFPDMQTIDLSSACDGTDHKHQKTSSVAISGTGKEISSMLVCNIRRSDTGTDDTWASILSGQLPLFLEIDFHYPIDMVGSRGATTK
jgi:hypothetical protein